MHLVEHIILPYLHPLYITKNGSVLRLCFYSLLFLSGDGTTV